MSAASIPKPRETVFTVLSEEATRLSPTTLSAVALISGVIALAAVLLKTGSWTLFGACYSLWCFAGWGLYFRNCDNVTRTARFFGYVMVVSGFTTIVTVMISLYLATLGPRWNL